MRQALLGPQFPCAEGFHRLLPLLYQWHEVASLARAFRNGQGWLRKAADA